MGDTLCLKGLVFVKIVLSITVRSLSFKVLPVSGDNKTALGVIM